MGVFFFFKLYQYPIHLSLKLISNDVECLRDMAYIVSIYTEKLTVKPETNTPKTLAATTDANKKDGEDVDQIKVSIIESSIG